MRKKLLAGALAIILILIGAFSIISYYQQQIPEELERLLEQDMASHASIGTAPVYVPSIVDRVVGYKGYRFHVKQMEYMNETNINSSKTELCIELQMVYRVPTKASVYSFGSPKEEFLYFAQKEHDRWAIQFIRQSGVNQTLSDHSCSKNQ